jgi:hypothetical protein
MFEKHKNKTNNNVYTFSSIVLVSHAGRIKNNSKLAYVEVKIHKLCS